MFFTRKGVNEEIKLKLYSIGLERVRKFKFLGLWFDERLTWGVHVQELVDKCKKVLNILRCLGRIGERIRREMIAILLVVQWVEDSRPLKTIICSDSSAALVSLQNGHLKGSTSHGRRTPPSRAALWPQNLVRRRDFPVPTPLGSVCEAAKMAEWKTWMTFINLNLSESHQVKTCFQN
ncbi:tudor domain-containing protein 1/4/6/7 [Sarotherodon galilaeus]